MKPSGRQQDPARRGSSFVRMWGPPILIIFGGSTLGNVPGSPPIVSGLLWSIGLYWSGLSCLHNALRCGRLHCTVLRIAHPLLALVAIAVTFHIIALGWSTFWLVAFLPVTAGSFIPELFGLMYVGPKAKGVEADSGP